MRVLIIHQHFNTPEKGGPLRSYYLSKALLDAGIEPVVITAHNQKTAKIEQVEGIEVHYLPVDYDNRFGYYKRGWAFLKFVFGAIRLASRIKKIDLCYAISAPLTVGIAARAIKARLNVAYIFEVGDLWPDAPIQLGFIKNGLVKAALYWLEKTTYRHAKCIVALSDPIKTSIEAKAPGKKVHVITNMSDTDFFGLGKRDDSLAEKYGVKGKFVISYIGAIGVANGLEFFIDCARSSQRAGLPVHFLICGDGALKQSIESSIKQLELGNCTILPFQNRDAVRKLLNITDTVFVCYKPYPILETGSPNKYFDGLASGKLIIVNFGGWIKQEIEKEGCGVSIRNPDDIAKAISPFLSDSRVLEKFQEASKTLAQRKYSRRILSARFVDLIKLANATFRPEE